MPWQECDVKKLRLEFVLRSLSETAFFEELCREYGISSKTGYKWKQRFLESGISGLADRSRRPLSSPEALPEDTVCEMIRIKEAHRTWGPHKIRGIYARRHPSREVPSDSSFKRVLDKAGLVEKRRTRHSEDTGRLQTRAPAKPPTAEERGRGSSSDRKSVTHVLNLIRYLCPDCSMFLTSDQDPMTKDLFPNRLPRRAHAPHQMPEVAALRIVTRFA